jgi:transposase
MDTNALFSSALGLTDPWYVAALDLDPAAKRLEIRIDFRRGGTFTCAECGAGGCKAHDTAERRWRHLDFFQFRTELVARTPRVDCARCGVHPVAVPWARAGSGFTLLFEALVLAMAPQMPMAAVARLVDEHDTRLWRLIERHVTAARGRRRDHRVRRVGLDETASRRGHQYITLFVDLDRSRLLFATPGRDAQTVQRFREDLAAHGGQPEQLEEVCCDMAPPYLKGLAEAFPGVPVTFDRFHLVQLVNQAVDRTRRAERRERPDLRTALAGHRYTFLRKPDTLSDAQLGYLAAQLQRSHTLKTVRAFHLKLVFLEVFSQPRRAAAAYLRRWCRWARDSGLPEMERVAATIRRHWEGVLRWFSSHISNGVLEGLNSLIQAAKAKARGYRTVENLITMAYLIAGQLRFNVPHFR